MQSRQEGLTKPYNRFHDLAEAAAEIATLHAPHIEMDQAATGYPDDRWTATVKALLDGGQLKRQGGQLRQVPSNLSRAYP